MPRLADLLTGLRLLLLPCLLLNMARGRWLAALAVLVLAGLTDLLDGVVARAAPRPCRHGVILDLTADLLLILGASLVLSRAGVFSPFIPLLILLSFGSFSAVCLRKGAVAFSRFGRYTGAFCWVCLGMVLLARPDEAGPGPIVLAIVQPLLAAGLIGSIMENSLCLFRRMPPPPPGLGPADKIRNGRESVD